MLGVCIQLAWTPVLLLSFVLEELTMGTNYNISSGSLILTLTFLRIWDSENNVKVSEKHTQMETLSGDSIESHGQYKGICLNLWSVKKWMEMWWWPFNEWLATEPESRRWVGAGDCILALCLVMELQGVWCSWAQSYTVSKRCFRGKSSKDSEQNTTILFLDMV